MLVYLLNHQEGKKSGIGGFFQGVGIGLIRKANNLIIGIKNIELIFYHELKNERFKYPRTIQKAITINSYNEDDALISAILDYLRGYDEHEII